MASAYRLLLGLATIGFVGWLLVSFRADLAALSFRSVWQAWDVVLLALVLSLINYFLRFVRWHWYLRRLGHSPPPRASSLAYFSGFAFSLSPAKLGELVRARFYGEMRIPLPDVLVAFFVERLIDLLAMLLLAVMLLIQFPHYWWAIWCAVVLIGTGFILLSVRWDAVTGWMKLPHPARGRASIAQKLGATLGRARSLLEWRVVIAAALIGVVAWGLEGTGLAALLTIRPPGGIEFTAALGVYAASILVGALSFLPGGLGTTEAAMTALLATHGYSVADAALITLVCRVVTLWFAVGLGWLAFIAVRARSVSQISP